MRTKIYVAVILVIAITSSIVLWHERFAADFYPPDRSFVGPNLVASIIQFAVIFVAATLLYPPFRKAMERIAHEANAEVHAKLERNAKLLQHVIRHHPGIPNTDRHGNLLVDPPEAPKKAAPVKKAAVKKVARKPAAQPKE